MEKQDIMLMIFCVLYFIFLYFYAAGRALQLDTRLRPVFGVPLLALVFHIAVAGAEACLAGLYLGIALVAVCTFHRSPAKQRKLCITGTACVLLTVLPCGLYSGYRNPHYTEEFIEGFEVMKEHYVLSRYKEVDWDRLYRTYVVRFREADAAKDPDMAFDVWQSFTREFHDAHVSCSLRHKDAEFRERYGRRHAGADYGFSLVTLADGSVVFADVDPDSEAYADGIRNGMTVAGIDGQGIGERKKQADLWFDSFPDKENEAFYESLAMTAGKTETLSVQYLDWEGNMQTADFAGQGSGYDRFVKTAVELLGVPDKPNLSIEMASEDTACLVINDMMVDPGVSDMDCEESVEAYGGLKARLKEKIKNIKSRGAEKLIIDLRSNPGGALDMSIALASLFTGKEQFAAGEGSYHADTGSYEMVDSVHITPDNVWGDGAIVVLVNSDTASAAELFACFMGRLDHVTVMGMTKSTGSVMMTNAYELKRFRLSFPVTLLLDENGDILIDSDASRCSKLPLDVRIPFDREAFSAMIEEGQDYVLDYAVRYLSDADSGVQ